MAFFRVREAEFISGTTGRSMRLQGAHILRHPSARQMVQEVAANPRAYKERQTDGGLRHEIAGGNGQGEIGVWYLYQ
jgi:hypothetical protein